MSRNSYDMDDSTRNENAGNNSQNRSQNNSQNNGQNRSQNNSQNKSQNSSRNSGRKRRRERSFRRFFCPDPRGASGAVLDPFPLSGGLLWGWNMSGGTGVY